MTKRRRMKSDFRRQLKCHQRICHIGSGLNTEDCYTFISRSWSLPGDSFYQWVRPRCLFANVGVILGVAQSSLHIPVQFAFLILTTIGVIFAILYNSATPDFYENNAHHKIGWVIVWMLVAQFASGMIRGVARYVNGDIRSRDSADDPEDMFILGDCEDDDDDAEIKPRGSLDSGNETGESTPRGGSTSTEPSAPYVARRSSENTLRDDHQQRLHHATSRPRNAEAKMEMYLAKKLNSRRWMSRVSRRGLSVALTIHQLIGRPMFVLGFIQFCTGMVTVTGISKGNHVYNGLAHFIKGTSSMVC